MFGLLAKIAPMHYAVDEARWKQHVGRAPAVNCAPLINIAHMKSASACHACGRCSGEHGAVKLALRSPAKEILATSARQAKTEEALTLLVGVMGIATAAFMWSSSRRLAAIKTALAEWLIERDYTALLQDDAPWWLLTHYPQSHDVFTWLDGLCILVYIVGGGGALGLTLCLLLWLAARALGQPAVTWQRLSLALVPMAGVGVFLGLSMLTLGHLKAEGVSLTWVSAVGAALLLLGGAFSAYLIVRLCWTGRSLRVMGALLLAWLALVLTEWVWIRALFGA